MKPKRKNRSVCSLPSVIALAAFGCSSLHAADILWDAGGGADTNYNTATNWAGDAVPTGAANNALVDTGTVTVTTDTPAIGIFEVGRWFNPAATLNHSSGTINANELNVGFYAPCTYSLTGSGGGAISGAFNIGFGAGNGTATINTTGTMATGFVGVANGTFNDAIDHPTGNLTITNGTLSATGSFFMAGSSASTGTVTHNSGTVSIGDQLWVANRGTGTFNQSGGTVSTNQWFVLSRFGAAKGTYNLTGGTVNATREGGNVALISEGGAGATGTLNVSGGIFNVGDIDTESDLWITEIYGGGGGTGEVTISGTGAVNVSNEVWLTKNASGTATLNLDGGTLDTEKVAKGDGTGTVNFNGGLLKATQAGAEFLTATRVNVRDGGAVIQSDFDIGIVPALQHSNVSGDLPLDGGLIKNGGGILKLGGTNTYTGPTVINGGGLIISGGLASSVALNSGLFDGSGSIGALTVANAYENHVTNGQGGTTPLTTPALTFDGTAVLTANRGASTPIVVSGLLKTTGANGQVVINIGGAVPNGLVNLIQFGTFSGSISDFAIGNTPGLSVRQSVDSLEVNGNNIAANIVGEGALVWSGLGGAVWETSDFGDETGPHNWAAKAAHTATNFWAGDNVEFNDTYNTGGGNVAVTQTTVSITGGNVVPGTTTFNNSSVNYTLDSSDASGIEGGSLTKNGTGKLTILNNNPLTNTTTVNAGTLELGNGTTDGNIPESPIVANGTLAYNWANNHTVTNVISGTGSLVKNGGGELRITSVNPFTGTVTVNAGNLMADAGNGPTARNFSQVSGIVVNNGGTLRSTPNSLFGWDGSQARPITINAGGTAVAHDSDLNVGLVTLNGGTLASTNITEVNSGWGSWNFARATAKKLLVTENSTASALQVGFRNGATIEVAAGKTLAFTGTITDSNDGVSTVIKEGAGTLTFSGANTYTGNTTVNAGILSITNNSATTFADASTVTIASGAKLNLPNNTTDTVTALVVNGSPLPAGIYGSTTPATSAHITGSGKIEVTGTSGYGSWAATHVGGAAANVDTDGDGVSNGVEYFMNAAAGFTASPSPDGTHTVTWTNGGNIPASAYGTQFVIQTSTDLVTWANVPVGNLVSNTDGPAGSVSYTITGSGKQFVRLSINPN